MKPASRLRRFLFWLAAGTGGLVLAAAIGVAALICLTLPGEGGTTRLLDLSAPVTVTFDRHGVPFIRAANRADAAEALGYLHARSRLFQMDVMRRAAEGRLAAWFGKRALHFDEHMRELDLSAAALASENLLTPGARRLLAAYARGVNARIAECGRLCAWQYLIYGKPKPWHILDSMLWGEMLADELSGNAELELDRLRLSETMSAQKIDSLWPRVGVPPPTVALAAYPPGTREAARAALAGFPRDPSPFRRTRTESNEFAVGAARSATGAPLLAGDPHLGFQFPGLWYLARIDTPEQSLAGATAPEVPFMVFGHNRQIAWTFTNNGAAVQDIVVFRRVGADRYQTPQGPVAFGIRDETIAVAGAKPVHFVVRTTIAGPVVGLRKDSVLALEAVNLTHDNHAADGLFDLDTATTIGAAERAAGLITTPVQNLLVASRRRIGLIVTGCVPLRASGDGAWPIDGSEAGRGWSGLACGDRLPRFIAPAGNILVNTNEQVAPPGFPVDFGADQLGDWRSIAIRRDLARHQKLTPGDFVSADYDIRSAYAAALMPYLDAVTPKTEVARRALTLLRHWDFRMARGAPQPLIFNEWLRRFRLDVLKRNHVPPALARPGRMEFVAALVTDGKQAALWCRGGCGKLLVTSADQAMAELARKYGDDPKTWRWGRAHRVVFADPLVASIPLLGRLLLPAISVPGDGSTVDRSAPGPEGWTAVLGPSYRGVYDLADLDASRFTIAPGESGDIVSPHARDFLKSWRDGRMILLARSPRHVAAKLELRP